MPIPQSFMISSNVRERTLFRGKLILILSQTTILKLSAERTFRRNYRSL